MKPIIGIVSNYNFNDNITISDDIVKAVELSLGEPIVIVTKAEEEIGKNVLDICDAFIFQGGSQSSDYHYKIVEYAFKNNKPIMGICLGMQVLAKYFFGGGSVDFLQNIEGVNVDDHSLEYISDESIMHKIRISPKSHLYTAFGSETFVNSRHKKAVTGVLKPFIISSRSYDNIIESFEFIDDNNYIVGYQFHPENMDSMKVLFDRFIKKCN